MKIPVYTLSAFAKTPTGGNPAGVVLEASDLTEAQMGKIAEKVGFSETAFVQKSDKADFKVRFFTPNAEVDLCGHATIATFSLMKNMKLIEEGHYTQETKAGILNIEAKADDVIFMNQTLPVYSEIIDKAEAAKCLNISVDDMIDELPVEVVSTGLRDIIVPLKSMETLYAMNPDFDAISELSRKYDAVGFHVFTFETKLEGTAHCRNFAPLYDIPEESATGTANGALSAYLYKHGKISAQNEIKLIFEQGYSMEKPSEILAELVLDESRAIREVKVGGRAVVTGMKEIEI